MHDVPGSPASKALTGRAAGDAPLPMVVAGARAAGGRERFSADARPGSREEAFAASRADAVSLAVLRGPLAGTKRTSGPSGVVSEEGPRDEPPNRYQTVETDIANLALQLELPILSGASIADLVSVRPNEGEAFLSFRTALQRQLRELRHVADPEERRRRLQDVEHELEAPQLDEVRAQARRAARGVAGEGVLGTATMAAALHNPGATFFLLLTAALAGAKALHRILGELRAHPAHFLWRVNRRR